MENEIKEKVTAILNEPIEEPKTVAATITKPVPHRLRKSTNSKVKSWIKKTNSTTYDETFTKIDKILREVI